MIKNPYQYLLPVRGGSFVGRWDLVHEVASDLVSDLGNSHAIIAGRRCGKSSFLLTLAQELQERSAENAIVLPLYFDLKRKRFRTAEEFLAWILLNLRRHVHKNPHLVVRETENDLVADDHDRFEILAKMPGLSLDDFEEAVAYILNTISSSFHPTRIVLLFDEMDETLEQSWTGLLYNQLRALVYSSDLMDNFRLVLTGSRGFLDELSVRGSPLWNILQIHFLLAIQESHLNQLAALSENVPATIVSEVWRHSGGHPFLANYLFHEIHNLQEKEVSLIHTSDLIDSFFAQYSYHFESWCQTIGPVGLRVYQVLAREKDWLGEDIIADIANIDPLETKHSLVVLCYHDVIIHEGNWRNYRITGALFEGWFEKYGATFGKTDKAVGGISKAMYELPPEVRAQAALFLFEIGRLAAKELRERWVLARSDNSEEIVEVDITESSQEAEQTCEYLLDSIALEQTKNDLEQSLDIIGRKRTLILEWQESKLDNEEEYGHQRITRATLRLRQKELNQKIYETMFEIERDLRGLGIEVIKRPF